MPSPEKSDPSLAGTSPPHDPEALALDPADRYGSAADLAADVERALADEPVTAWREPRSARVRRWARRHPQSLAAVTATPLVGIERGGGRAEHSLGRYREALAIRLRLAADAGEDAALLRGILVSHFNVGMALEDLSRGVEAHAADGEAAAVGRTMVDKGLNLPKSREDLAICEEAFARTAPEPAADP